MSVDIPSSMREHALFFLSPAAADEWVDRLPELLNHYAESWQLELRQVLTGGVMSCCVKCDDATGRPAVLKIPLDQEGGSREAAALTDLSLSDAVPELLRSDRASGVTLMRYVAPGELSPDVVGHFADLFDRLHGDHSRGRSVTFDYPALRTNVDLRLKWATDRFENPEYAEGRRFFGGVEERVGELLAGRGRHALLHGDLQAKNILPCADGRYYAIDPLPVMGDPHYDAAFWCVMEMSGLSVEANLQDVHRRVDSIEWEPLLEWAKALAAIEFRPYLPDSRRRLLSFLEGG